MLEVMLMILCLKGEGCTDASHAYYEYNTEIKQSVKNINEKLKNKLTPWEYNLISTTIGIATTKKYVFELNKHNYLVVESNNIKLEYKYSF